MTRKKIPLGFDLGFILILIYFLVWGFIFNCVQEGWKKVKLVNNIATKFYISGTL